MNHILLALPVPLAIMLVGGRDLLSCAYIIYMGSASEQWPKLPVRITASNVIDGLGLRDGKCRVHVEYEFTTGGGHFRGQTLHFGQPLWERSQAEQIAAKYPIGAVVDAFCCPENPNLSVLESGFGSTVPRSALFGGVFFIVGTYVLRLCYKEWRKQEKHSSRVGRSKR